MNQADRQFWQIIRSFIIRYQEYNRQKGVSVLQLEQSEHAYAKMLCNRELKDVVINKMTSIQLKSDYHNLIMLTFLQDLSKWSLEYYESLKDYPGPLECILSQSIAILNSQQQFHTIVPKQNQLISALLSHPYTLSNIDPFKILYRKLKDIKEFYPSAIRQHQKQCFLKSIEQCIEISCQLKNNKIIQFIFQNIFNQLQRLQQTHQYVSQRLRIIKQIVKKLWCFHQDILYKISYLIMKYSYQILTNKHLFNYVLPIYEVLIDKLIQKDSIAPLLVYRHLILNNIEKILKEGSNFIMLQILICQISNIFYNEHYLKYFMRNYDWNYMQLSICQESLQLLYSYTENRANQKKVEFQLIKSYINRIHSVIKNYLQNNKKIVKDQGVWKFYQIKKKQYFEILQQMNEKPKKIFKRIEGLGSSFIKDIVILKYVKLIKKSAQLKCKSMIDIFSTDNSISAQMFARYVQIVLKQCKQSNLQEFMRLFTSNFFLTGESQQIARVMDTITQLYYRHQEESNRILKSSDSTYTFANAILILNTDLHNPKNQEKMSQDNFIKMCKKINQGEDLPLDVIKKTYFNIKNNKINTFRDRGNMIGISVSNWLNICTDYQSINLAYYDEQLKQVDQKCMQFFIYDMLSTIIDEKETSKLELLVQRFMYDDKIFQCQIIEVLRKIVDKKSHLPLHILQKIMELANFKNNKVNQKILSYYWLAANIILTFSSHIPTNLICEFLVFTWSLRIQLQDFMYLRQSAELKRIRNSMRFIQKKQSKRSIMNMFSSFLSFKQSDQQIQVPPTQISKKHNLKSISNNIFDLLKHSQSHKSKAIQFLMIYIHNDQSKLYQQFVSCLFLTFNLLYCINNCQKIGEDLFYELLSVKQSSITKRLNNLNKKDNKLYNILINYCKFWIVKLLLKQYHLNKIQVKQNNNYLYLLQKSLEYLQKIDKEILIDFIKEINRKEKIQGFIFSCFDKIIKKIIDNKAVQDIKQFYNKYQKINQNKINEHIQQKIIKTKSQKINQKKEDQVIEQAIQNNSSTNNNNIEQQNYNNLKQQIKHLPYNELTSSQNHIQPQKLSEQSKKNTGQQFKQSGQQKVNDPSIAIKSTSIKQIQSYINPDELINAIQNEIQEHSKIKEQEKQTQNKILQILPQKPQNIHQIQLQRKDENIQKKGQNIQEVGDENKEQESPSIHVVIF